MPTETLLHTSLPRGLRPGKVRDSYDLGDQILLVATDRISAFDVVMNQGIPGKGMVLSQLSAFWFEKIDSVVPTHFIRLADGTKEDGLPTDVILPPNLIGRSTIAWKAQRIDVECIVRGYIAGSAWSEYSAYGTVGGVRLPSGMREGEQFPEPIFTPSTKSQTGHDENITYQQFEAMVGRDVANVLKLRSLSVYRYAWQYAVERGIIIADTKFEFGYIGGEPTIIDEVLTPDSSRFWPVDGYRPGASQPSFDKQYLRDWLESTGWNKEPPPPDLPHDVIEATAERYREAFRRLTGAEVRSAGQL